MKKQPPEVFCKKIVFKNFAKVPGKKLCRSLFINKVESLKKTDSNTSVFLQILQNF